MVWSVGDMTAMPEHGGGLFDVVLDKGALDALMSEDTEEVHRKVRGAGFGVRVRQL